MGQARNGCRAHTGHMPGAAEKAGEAAAAGSSGQWREVGRELVRAFSGGMILGIPLLYTMEVWQVGVNATPGRLLVVLFGMLIPVFFLVRVQGFWSRPARGFGDALVQTVQAVGIALASVAVVLVVLRQLTWSMPIPDVAGRLVFEAVPFALGAAIASAAVGGSRDQEQPDSASGDKDGARSTVQDLGATAIGALVIGLSVAPTDEVSVLAAQIPPPWLLGVVALSLVSSYVIVFAAGFLDERKRRKQMGWLQRPITETMASYLVALAVSAVMLWFFDNLALDGPPHETVARVLVLGLPAAIGGGAGRLVV